MSKEKLKHKIKIGILTTLIVLFNITGTSFAWYIYNLELKATNVKMSAGSGTSILISNFNDKDFSSAIAMKDFNSSLIPVSTDNILNGFQKVEGFKKENGLMFANMFSNADDNEFCTRTLYLKTNSDQVDVYLSDLTAINKDENNPLSTALRVGFVFYKDNHADQYIFEPDESHNPRGQFNTYNATTGQVLDSTKNDGSVVDFKPLTKENLASYDENIGEVKINNGSEKMITLNRGEVVKVDVYFWLEGCDEDCFNNLVGKSLETLSMKFVGVEV